MSSTGSEASASEGKEIPTQSDQNTLPLPLPKEELEIMKSPSDPDLSLTDIILLTICLAGVQFTCILAL